MNQFVDYIVGISFGFTLICVILWLVRGANPVLKLVFCIIGFLFVRDNMTKYELWEFGKYGQSVWFRFIDNGIVLLLMAGVSFVLVILMHYFVFKKPGFVRIIKQAVLKEIVAGILSAVVIALPFLLIYQGIAVEDRGGHVAPTVLVALFVFCIFGNSLEEYLFRGCLQPYFEKQFSPHTAVLLSAFSFMIGHLWLASLITDMGIFILVFTFWEGLVCALLARKYGLLACTLAHGGAIFFISSGLI